MSERDEIEKAMRVLAWYAGKNGISQNQFDEIVRFAYPVPVPPPMPSIHDFVDAQNLMQEAYS